MQLGDADLRIDFKTEDDLSSYLTRTVGGHIFIWKTLR